MTDKAATTIADTASVCMDPLDRDRPFKMLSAIHHPRIALGTDQRSIWKSAVANRLYLTRDIGEDLFGRVPDFSAKRADLGEHGRRGPIGCETSALEGLKLWQAADAAAAIDRPELPVAFHAIGWLPLERSEEAWRTLVYEFCDDVLVRNGMVADWAIHRLADACGGWTIPPHVHLVITARSWRRKLCRGGPNPTTNQIAKVGWILKSAELDPIR